MSDRMNQWAERDHAAFLYGTPNLLYGAPVGLDVPTLTRAIELAVGADVYTADHLTRLAKAVALYYDDLIDGLPSADDVRGMLR